LWSFSPERRTFYPPLGKDGDNFRERGAVNSPLDPQLQLLIKRWPTLSKKVQQQIMLLDG
jgi:hypothetical protein